MKVSSCDLFNLFYTEVILILYFSLFLPLVRISLKYENYRENMQNPHY